MFRKDIRAPNPERINEIYKLYASKGMQERRCFSDYGYVDASVFSFVHKQVGDDACAPHPGKHRCRSDVGDACCLILGAYVTYWHRSTLLVVLIPIAHRDSSYGTTFLRGEP